LAQRMRFDLNALHDFVTNGWLLALDADRLLVGWGEWSESAVPPANRHKCAVFAPDFYLRESHPWKSTAQWDLVSRDQFASLFMTGIGRNVNCEQLRWSEPRKAQFASAWARIQEGFRERGLLKAVPVVFATTEADLSDQDQRLALLMRLARSPRHLYLYGMWSENAGLLGATPELLFERGADGWVRTVALAGTRAHDGPRAAELLFQDPKERFEHQLVIDDIRERLAALGEVEVGGTEVIELPTLYHLRTRLALRPKSAPTFSELVERLHPTPALGLFPRALGFAEMRRWDDSAESRGRFGAPFGVCFEGGETCVVAIRNIQWQGRELRLGSGCGVVGASQMAREWSELALKRDSVKRMLGL